MQYKTNEGPQSSNITANQNITSYKYWTISVHNVYNKMMNFTQPFLPPVIQKCIVYSETVYTVELGYNAIEETE
jgi:hypothetical protein